jgi:competence protein ComEC
VHTTRSTSQTHRTAALRVTLILTVIALAIAVAAPASAHDDIPADHPHHGAITTLTDAGIASGYPDGTYRPDGPVERAQLASLVARAAHLETDDDPPFTDVAAEHPHARGIAAAADRSLVRGYPDGTFRAQEATTRGQVATVLAQTYRFEADPTSTFRDVPADHPHLAGIAALAEHGIAQGHADGTYRPDEAISRGQIATLLVNADPQL